MAASLLMDRVAERMRQADLRVIDSALQAFCTYLELLARWNRRMNLTSLALDPPSDAALDRLLVEPVAVAAMLPDEPLRWFDFGSGGGSPAIPIRILRPSAWLTMIEAKARKAAFLREATRTLELEGTDVFGGRFEVAAEAGALRSSAQIVTARAVRPDDILGDAAASLLAPGGRLILIGSAAHEENLYPDWFSASPSEQVTLPGGSHAIVLIRR